ncbi:MAG: N-acetyl-gamma-glutamyl-phosphate reductase [Candidatus Howiella sp.]|jgi:N-acetyl-gamma-glutamyl-phosphate reductase
MTIRVGIIGATGYAGAELVRLLLSHPEAELTALGSKSFAGQKLSEVYPAYRGLCDLICEENDAVIDKSDVVFAALPHGLSQEIAKHCADTDKAFIDIGADFRLEKEAEYKQWYGLDYRYPELHASAVYGLPELFREEIRTARIIANPGCYPTSVGLGLFPALKAGLVSPDGIIIDSKSGTTGAGRGLAQNTHFPDCNEGFAPYKVAAHRHTPEIEQTLSRAAGRPVLVTFVPHLLPINRGIVSTIYAHLSDGVNEEAVRRLYTDFYKNEPFVRLLPAGETASLKYVKESNFCDISLHFDGRTGTLIVVSAIDNMVKGAAGQAIQNMNLLFGLAEDTGLRLTPPAF